MSNRRLDPVTYRTFRPDPLLSDGLLAVERQGGDLERKVAAGLARVADEYRQKVEKEAVDRSIAAGDAAGRSGRPGAISVSGGQTSTASVNGQAGHVKGAQGGVRVRVPPAEIRKIIVDAAIRHGQDPDALTQFAGIESSFNPLARNPNSTAGGLFQFLDGTARDYGLRDKFDPAAASDAAARLMKDNRAYLLQRLGRDPTPGELYLAHQQGAGGAAKLLVNPDARAIDVVGADAIRLNGGSADMSAGQFASKWTSKVGGYSKLPTAASVGPVSVTVVEEPVEVTPGKAGGFRPTGRKDAAGRAYDVAGTKTYLEELKFTMLQDQQAVYDAYKDDPAMLEKAMGELETAHMRDHVFPEIESEYSLDFRKSAYLYVQKAKGEHEERKAAENRMAALDRASALENEKSRALAGLNPNDPDADARLANIQASIDAHWDSAVARGIVDLDDAEKFKRTSRSEMTVGFYVRQASKLGADEIKAMRSDMTKDYSEGALDGVTADDWTKIDQGLAAAQSAARTQGKQANDALAKRGKDIAERTRRGLPVAPEELARFELDAGTAPEGDAIVRSTYMKLGVSEAIRTQPLGKVKDKLWEIMAAYGDVTPDEYDYATKQVAAHEAEVIKDPLGVAERFSIVPQQTSLPDPAEATPDEMAGALAARIVAADAAAEHFGVKSKIFRPHEQETISRAITSTNVDQHLSAMQQLDVLAGSVGLREVEHLFGKDGVDRLQDWQARVRYASPEEAKQWLRDRNDPAWQERVKPLIVEGEKAARKVSEADVVDLLDENALWDASGPQDSATRGAMMGDFVRLVGERTAAIGDVSVAKEQAIERMRKVWGVTSAFGGRGGRLMLYPPEGQYPSIAGDFSWIGDELAAVATERGIERDQMSLVSDGKTRAAIERGEQPGYLLSQVDPETGLEGLVTDEHGRPLRHFFDPAAAREKAQARAAEARRTRNDPWLVFGRNSAVGPLYVGGAHPADLVDRQSRIDEIIDERDRRLDEKRRRREILRRDGLPGDE